MSSRKIALNYFFGRFWLDLLSAIPFETVILLLPKVDSEIASRMVVISCLKLIRILRLGRLINYLNSSDDFKLQLRLFKLCFMLFLYIHVTACIWYFVCEFQNGKVDGKINANIIG